jgi:hypothetical protein
MGNSFPLLDASLLPDYDVLTWLLREFLEFLPPKLFSLYSYFFS